MNLMRSWIKAPLREAPGAGAGGTTPDAPDFSWAPEAFKKDDGYDTGAFRARFDELEAAEAVRAENMAKLPESPEGYKMELPEVEFGDMELPEGFKFELDTGEDLAPIYAEMQGILHNHKLPAEAAQELLGVLAKYQATMVSRSYKEGLAEYEKLGPTAESRINSVERFLEGKLSSEHVEALKRTTGSAAGVKAMEALISKMSTKIPSPPAQPNGVDVENMNPMQRLRYANSLSS